MKKLSMKLLAVGGWCYCGPYSRRPWLRELGLWFNRKGMALYERR